MLPSTRRCSYACPYTSLGVFPVIALPGARKGCGAAFDLSMLYHKVGFTSLRDNGMGFAPSCVYGLSRYFSDAAEWQVVIRDPYRLADMIDGTNRGRWGMYIDPTDVDHRDRLRDYLPGLVAQRHARSSR